MSSIDPFTFLCILSIFIFFLLYCCFASSYNLYNTSTLLPRSFINHTAASPRMRNLRAIAKSPSCPHAPISSAPLLLTPHHQGRKGGRERVKKSANLHTCRGSVLTSLGQLRCDSPLAHRREPAVRLEDGAELRNLFSIQKRSTHKASG